MKTISDESMEFIRAGMPFKARARAQHRLSAVGWVVRSKIGEEVALVEDEITAVAISESLNAAGTRLTTPSSATRAGDGRGAEGKP